jgi:hypothetical protein
MMNSISSCAGGRVLGREHLVDVQVVAIAHAVGVVELGVLVAHDGGGVFGGHGVVSLG